MWNPPFMNCKKINYNTLTKSGSSVADIQQILLILKLVFLGTFELPIIDYQLLKIHAFQVSTHLTRNTCQIIKRKGRRKQSISRTLNSTRNSFIEFQYLKSA